MSDIIGSSVTRVDALDKVTGAARFADDFQFGPGLLYGRLVRSPHPHALIKRIDVTRALALLGVKAIATGADTPGHIGLYLQDRHIFATDRVRYIGDPVAGVVATSEEIAEQACKLVEVEYEVLPAVTDPLDAIKEHAPLLHPELGKYEVANFIFPKPGTNVSNHFKIRKGDVQKGFAESDVIVEGEFRVPHIQHVPIEPHIAVAQADSAGKITLWASSQSPFAQRNLIAKALNISQGDVRVIAPYLGGGFGSKAGVSMEACTVVMAIKTPGRPVKLRLTREEEFFTTFVRQGLVARTKIGAKKDGHFVAMQTEYYWDAGAYTEYGVNMTRAGGYSSTGAYAIPNVQADSYCCYTNHPVGGPMRGFGMPEIHWGIEQLMDQVAEKLGMDSRAFRLKNCIKTGSEVVTGWKMHPTKLDECIEKAAAAIDWGKSEPASAPHKRRGKGLAIMWKAPAMPPNAGSSSHVRLNEDATVSARPVEVDLSPAVASVVAAALAPEAPAPTPVPARSPVARDPAPPVRGQLGDLLASLARADASDVLVVAGKTVAVRRTGGLERLDTVAPGEAELLALCAPALQDRDRRALAEGGSVDLALELGAGPVARFRVNLFRHTGGLTAALRPIRDRVPGLSDLGLPSALVALGELPFGLVLFTGPTGSGKSTTLAALIEQLNQTVDRHVITLEDPIEFVYPPGRCLIHQRELHAHVPSFAEGLRAALREAPDVILVGEMRDPETIAAALTAAETGHLVLSTLHCGTAALAMDRIVDGFPEHRRLQVRAQLADVLRAVVSQRLLPAARGEGRVPAVEILQVTPAVAALIREGRAHQLPSLIQTGREHGMVPMERALAALVRAGKVTPAAALAAAPDRKALADLIGG